MREESTTPDVVELMRSAFEALNRRDFDVMPRIFAPDAVYDLSSQGLGIYEGRFMAFAAMIPPTGLIGLMQKRYHLTR
jgi:hypothetical protein